MNGIEKVTFFGRKEIRLAKIKSGFRVLKLEKTALEPAEKQYFNQKNIFTRQQFFVDFLTELISTFNAEITYIK